MRNFVSRLKGSSLYLKGHKLQYPSILNFIASFKREAQLCSEILSALRLTYTHNGIIIIIIIITEM